MESKTTGERIMLHVPFIDIKKFADVGFYPSTAEHDSD